MASRLSLYQSAALVVGERKPASLSENSPVRRRLDTVWDDQGVRKCLKRGFWNFAMRSVKFDYSPSIEPSFGYRRAFNKPTDWVRTYIVTSDEHFRNPIRYVDESGFWFADYDVIFVRFVSDDQDYGGDLSAWAENFTEFAAHWFASKIVNATTGTATELDRLDAKVKRLLLAARSTDAMDEPVQYPQSRWAGARISHLNREH
jgi:hypothetical protein